MIRYICEPKHDHKHYGGVTMMDVDEKAMAYCLIEALFAAGLLNQQRKALVEDSARAFLFIRKIKKMEVKNASSSICSCLNRA